jgi:hypothetical protein
MGQGFFGKLFGAGASEPGKPKPPSREVKWMPAQSNPWNVPLLDVLPVTRGSTCTSRDPRCATNAVSYGRDDGTSFIGQQPTDPVVTPVSLRYRRDRLLADGALFIPETMEHKWAIYFHLGTILFIRSWLRRVWMTARVEQSGEFVQLTEICGALDPEHPDARMTTRGVDFLIRSHALGLVSPAPLPRGMAVNPENAADWCLSVFGNFAVVASEQDVPLDVPEEPLRSHSLLHIAVARGDVVAVETQLRAGVPADLLAADGLPPLHWALASKGSLVSQLLLDHGSSVDERSAEGATPLMTATQSCDVEHMEFLLAHGADVNARDARGFTSLHRAAELGHTRAAEILLAHGGDPRVDAQGHTPLALAEVRGCKDIVKLMQR